MDVKCGLFCETIVSKVKKKMLFLQKNVELLSLML